MTESCSCFFCFGDAFFLLWPLTMFLAGIVLLITDTLQDERGCVQTAAVLFALFLVIDGPLFAFGFLLRYSETVFWGNIICSPLLVLPAMLFIYIGIKRMIEYWKMGRTTARIIVSELKQDPLSQQMTLSVRYQYTVGIETFTDNLEEIRPEKKKWVVEMMAERYQVGKEFPLSYAFVAPQRNIFKPCFPGSLLIGLGIMLFYWDAMSLCVMNYLVNHL